MRCSWFTLLTAYLGLLVLTHPALAASDAVTVNADGTVRFSAIASGPNILAANAPAAITGAVTLDASAAGKFYDITGTSSSYTIVLPPVSVVAGATIGFSVRSYALANKHYVIQGAGSDLVDERSSIALIHTNSLVLVSNGSRWVSIAKKTDTDWINAGAISVSTTGTAATKGAAQSDFVRWRRTGNSMEVSYEYYQTTAGAHGSGDYLFGIPGGHSIDTAQIRPTTGSAVNATVIGVGEYGGLTNVHYAGVIIASAYDATRLRFLVMSDSTSLPVNGYVGASFVGFGSANHGYTVRANVPILGW